MGVQENDDDGDDDDMMMTIYIAPDIKWVFFFYFCMKMYVVDTH